MGKQAKKKAKKVIPPKRNIQELLESRTGGQNGLRGYSYQFLYSCYLILSTSNSDISFQLEGIEDIDRITENQSGNDILHIQLKYSTNKQDASFLKDVLKNFLEAYLLDSSNSFKLVYDFPVATGNLSKLFAGKLDAASRTYWDNVILDIKKSHSSWNWALYDFDKFMSQISFEKVDKTTLSVEIENALIDKYQITTDNTSLFANSIKILCFEKMEQRGYVTKKEIDQQIENVKIDISKGSHNPAHSWIRKLDFTIPNAENCNGFFEGKKATPSDIARGLPIKRVALEQAIANSIQTNTVTVIKASSGQGKTTLALQTAYSLQAEYTPYQLLVCNDMQNIGNVVQFFKVRIRLGEKVLVLIDNLDNRFTTWNHLVQVMQAELGRHYKLLITTREIDWHHYAGDLSNLHSLNVVKPVLNEDEAMAIFAMFKNENRLHASISNWKQAWNKIAERQLLIEYVYLLTHGEMLSERIASQLSDIGKSSSGKAKCEILRKICFADVCGIRIPVSSLFANQAEETAEDYGELLKSMESEFLIHVNTEGGYIEGLHPIRSKHIIDNLHALIPIDRTAFAVIDMVNKSDLPILFSHLPEFDINRDDFFDNIVEKLWDEKDLSSYLFALQGLFSGSVMQYYRSYKTEFDDANSHGGLFIMSTEKCPFTTFLEFGATLDTLDKMREMLPENKNIAYLCDLRDRIPVCNLNNTCIYRFCGCLYNKLSKSHFSVITDASSYASIAEWLYNIDMTFNLTPNISLNDIWKDPERYSLDCISSLMYLSFCGNKDTYMQFTKSHLDAILTFLKHKTKSLNVYVDSVRNAIHVEYILKYRDIKKGNEQSVSRIKYICRTLPIFDTYCSDALKPVFNLLSAYTVPNDAHKEMPIRNVVIMFRQNLTSLWNKTIMSNYEFDTAAEWIEYWFDIRERICVLTEKYCFCIHKLLGEKPLGCLAKEIDQICSELARDTTGERRYPKEDRPFTNKATIPEGIGKIQSKYFGSFHNFMNQFVDFVKRDDKFQRLAIVNLTDTISYLPKMQEYFSNIADEFNLQEKHSYLCETERQVLQQLMMCCLYYKEHKPDKYFDKYQIKRWYEAYEKSERQAVEEGLLPMQSQYSIHFPNTTYTNGVLSYYPIVVENLDLTKESNINDWLIGCMPFADSHFDYLVLLCLNEEGVISPTAMQFSKRTVSDIKKAIQEKDDQLLAKVDPPYPIEATNQMISCFGEEYHISANMKNKSKDIPVGDIAEELWAYSTTARLLSNQEDSDYLATELTAIKRNISDMLILLDGELPAEEVSQIMSICDSVFSGQLFDETAFNELIEEYVKKSLTVQ